MAKLSASILGIPNKIDIINQINKSNIEYLHLDIQDSTMTNITTEYNIEDIDHSLKEIDIHIMANNPISLINKYKVLNPKYITIHTEINNVEECINLIKSYSIKVGLAIKLDTPIETLLPYLPLVDQVLVMSVNLGASGSTFDDRVIDKLTTLIKLKEEYNYVVSIDGGINNNTIKKLPSNIDILVSGSYLTSDIINNIKVLKTYE